MWTECLFDFFTHHQPSSVMTNDDRNAHIYTYTYSLDSIEKNRYYTYRSAYTTHIRCRRRRRLLLQFDFVQSGVTSQHIFYQYWAQKILSHTLTFSFAFNFIQFIWHDLHTVLNVISFTLELRWNGQFYSVSLHRLKLSLWRRNEGKMNVSEFSS